MDLMGTLLLSCLMDGREVSRICIRTTNIVLVQ